MSVPQHTKALTLTKPQSPLQLSLPSVAVPDPTARGSCTVRVLAAGIQPTTPIFLSGEAGFIRFPKPFVAGPHGVGRVLAVGSDATSLKEGDIVFIECFVRSRDDPVTTQILMGLTAGFTPAQDKLMGAWGHGLYRTVATIPLENAHRIDPLLLQGSPNRPLITPAELTISLPRLAVAYGGLSAVNLKPGQTILVGPATGFNSGAMVEMAAAMGARVIALSRNASKLRHVAETVSSTYPSSPRVETVVVSGDVTETEAAIRALLPDGSPGADAFIDITPATLAQPAHVAAAFSCLRPGAKVAIMGAVLKNLEVPYMPLMFKNITIKGQWMYSQSEVRELVRMVETGVVKVGKAAGHEVLGEWPLEDWETAMREVVNDSTWGKGCVFAPKDEE